MKKHLKPMLALWAIFLSFSLQAQDRPTYAQPAVPVGPTTTIEFDEPIYDFGAVKEGTVVSHTFTFTNTGDEPLVLSDAKGSCGCTVPNWPNSPIQPGETASVTVEFNSRNKKGRRNQKVTLTANTNPPQSFIYLQGKVLERAEGEELPSNVVEAKEEASCLVVYPNPTAEVLNLDVKDYVGQAASISIQSLSGQIMARRDVPVLDQTVEFQVGHYPAGTYYATIEIEGRKPEAHCFVVTEN